ncbi:unnamed protein product [Trichobilharzia regenti]|nr:unnamed protein product [Trichobilharzia regenti]
MQIYSAYAERVEREYRRERTRRSRSRSSSLASSRSRGPITSSFVISSKDIDEEEEAIKKKLEKKLREKEESYQKRLKQWEVRERKRANEYEHEREHEKKRQRELQIEAQRLKEFFEDYDDNVEDPKYYRLAVMLVFLGNLTSTLLGVDRCILNSGLTSNHLS